MFTRFGLDRELAAVESRLLAAVRSNEPLLEEMARSVIEAGGKRMRPFVALMAYRAVGGADARLADIVDIAAGLELIHTATLVHDDINDGAMIRRGRPTLHRRYGTANAIVVGDFLFTKGFQISGRFDENIVAWTGEACQMLAEGEILQGRFLNDPSITMEEYLTLVERKTASFISTGIRIGAYLGEAPDDVVAGLGRYGLNLGIAFQIVDDILDVTGDGAATGKDPGIDIRDGNPTLPSILTLQADSARSPELLQILRAERKENEDVETALHIIRGSGALEEARRLARHYGEAARMEAEEVQDPVWRQHLVTLVDLVLARDR